MRIKELFTIPENTKVTEKMFARVLISSVCSILLCMTCLAGTTWAWFSVSIENADNVIQIATVSENVIITNRNDHSIIESESGSFQLTNGEYDLYVTLENDAADFDDLNKERSPVYVLMSALDSSGVVQYHYFTFESGKTEESQVLAVRSELAVISFSVTWMMPASAEPAGDMPIVIGEETPGVAVQETESAEPETTSTEETASSETTEPTTIPTEETVPETTESSTVPSEPTESAEESED